MAEPRTAAPAFYARHGGRAADWWTLLHPPYTVWHLSYVVLGAAMAPEVDLVALGASVLAFFLAVGLAAHALDELSGRPLRTRITDRSLQAVAALSLAAACGLGIFGAFLRGPTNWPLAVAIPVGAVLLVGYNLELFGGRLHNDATFAWAWGGFPVAVGFVAQAPEVSWSVLLAAVAATLAGVGTSYAQRRLSTPARELRRRTAEVSGTITRTDGRVAPLDSTTLLLPLEGALRALSWALPAVALAALSARL
ncbi:MAG TPA: hypothetical protein VLB29_13210 [Nocardioidaceae bacterium]|nr:hypothetical protein [Nocardioidaceae bacterium]